MWGCVTSLESFHFLFIFNVAFFFLNRYKTFFIEWYWNVFNILDCYGNNGEENNFNFQFYPVFCFSFLHATFVKTKLMQIESFNCVLFLFHVLFRAGKRWKTFISRQRCGRPVEKNLQISFFDLMFGYWRVLCLHSLLCGIQRLCRFV